MVNETKIGSLPVASEGVQGEIISAFARINAVPRSATLIDILSDDIWGDADEHGIEAGHDSHLNEIDDSDVATKSAA